MLENRISSVDPGIVARTRLYAVAERGLALYI